MYAAYIGLIIYSLLNCFYGRAGFIAYDKLKIFEKEIYENISELEKLNGDLISEFERLRTSDELITLKARELGYIKDNEIMVKTSWEENRRNFYSIGRLLKNDFFMKSRKPMFRTISIGTAIVFFLLFLILLQRKNHDHKKG